MDRLKGLLSLPFTRKFFVGTLTSLATALLFFLNKKLGLGFSQAELLGFAGVAATTGAAVILGIAHEDAATKSNGKLPEPGKNGGGGAGNVLPLLFVLAFLAGSSGCVTVHQKDETTISHVQRTIDARQADFQRLMDEIKKNRLTAFEAQNTVDRMRIEAKEKGILLETPSTQGAVTTERDIKGFQMLNASELDHLNEFLKYEQAKLEVAR